MLIKPEILTDERVKAVFCTLCRGYGRPVMLVGTDAICDECFAELVRAGLGHQAFVGPLREKLAGAISALVEERVREALGDFSQRLGVEVAQAVLGELGLPQGGVKNGPGGRNPAAGAEK